MTATELVARLAEADRIRAILRRCTIEWRALGDRLLLERERGSERPDDSRTTGAAVAVERAQAAVLRGRPVRVLALEDFILFKVLSTRDRDLEDALAALRRSAQALDRSVLEPELDALAMELPEVDVRGRWTAIQQIIGP